MLNLYIGNKKYMQELDNLDLEYIDNNFLEYIKINIARLSKETTIYYFPFNLLNIENEIDFIYTLKQKINIILILDDLQFKEITKTLLLQEKLEKINFINIDNKTEDFVINNNIFSDDNISNFSKIKDNKVENKNAEDIKIIENDKTSNAFNKMVKLKEEKLKEKLKIYVYRTSERSGRTRIILNLAKYFSDKNLKVAVILNERKKLQSIYKKLNNNFFENIIFKQVLENEEEYDVIIESKEFIFDENNNIELDFGNIKRLITTDLSFYNINNFITFYNFLKNNNLFFEFIAMPINDDEVEFKEDNIYISSYLHNIFNYIPNKKIYDSLFYNYFI